MAKVRFGRKARLYYHTSAFTASGLVEVTRCKDIVVDDVANVMEASARDLEYDVAEQGGKSFSVTFEKLLEATDQTTLTALRDAYDNQTDLYFVVVNDVKGNASGNGVKWVGQVVQWNEKKPENGPGSVDVVLRNSDPDNPPARATTPLA